MDDLRPGRLSRDSYNDDSRYPVQPRSRIPDEPVQSGQGKLKERHFDSEFVGLIISLHQNQNNPGCSSSTFTQCELPGRPDSQQMDWMISPSLIVYWLGETIRAEQNLVNRGKRLPGPARSLDWLDEAAAGGKQDYVSHLERKGTRAAKIKNAWVTSSSTTR